MTHIPRLVLALALLLLSAEVAHAQPAPDQPAPAAPPWERWFAALNAGDIPGVVALMQAGTEADDGAEPRCAGGCLGMEAIEAGVAALVADGYRGAIDPASVWLVDGTVSFDVAETDGTQPLQVITHWMMELDGELITPACAGVCLRSPAARAATGWLLVPVGAVAPAMSAPAAPRAGAAARVPARRAAPPQPDVAASAAGPTPAGWLLPGLGAGLLVMAVSAALDAWARLRRPAAPPS